MHSHKRSYHPVSYYDVHIAFCQGENGSLPVRKPTHISKPSVRCSMFIDSELTDPPEEPAMRIGRVFEVVVPFTCPFVAESLLVRDLFVGLEDIVGCCCWFGLTQCLLSGWRWYGGEIQWH